MFGNFVNLYNNSMHYNFFNMYNNSIQYSTIIFLIYAIILFICWLYNKFYCRLLEDRISRLHGQLQRIHQQSCSENDTTILDFLNEDIHWLVMIAGMCTKNSISSIYYILLSSISNIKYFISKTVNIYTVI